MKDFLLKNSRRILALLGCTTVVTACYGTPYDIYDSHIISGRVVDADSGDPIPGIKVTVSQASVSSPGVLVPGTEYDTGLTDEDGKFESGHHGNGNAVIIQCKDIDGMINGNYQQKTEIFSDEETISGMITIGMKQIDKE